VIIRFASTLLIFVHVFLGSHFDGSGKLLAADSLSPETPCKIAIDSLRPRFQIIFLTEWPWQPLSDIVEKDSRWFAAPFAEYKPFTSKSTQREIKKALRRDEQKIQLAARQGVPSKFFEALLDMKQNSIRLLLADPSLQKETNKIDFLKEWLDDGAMRLFFNLLESWKLPLEVQDTNSPNYRVHFAGLYNVQSAQEIDLLVGVNQETKKGMHLLWDIRLKYRAWAKSWSSHFKAKSKACSITAANQKLIDGRLQEIENDDAIDELRRFLMLHEVLNLVESENRP
jgi:hypothetical protein